MELLLNSKKKQSLKRTIENSEKTVRTVKTMSSAILIVGLLGGILYALVNLLSPTLSMVSVQGVLRKDIGKIVFFSSVFLIPGILIPLFLKYLIINLIFSKGLLRKDEKLIFTDEGLEYSYRGVLKRIAAKRIKVRVDFEKLEYITHTAKTEELEFLGDFSSEYYYDLNSEEPLDKREISCLVIYDYFIPGLKEKLLDAGFYINEE
ncbi:MAG: hypothetical protein ACOX04_03145 [Candidatus Scatomorpha sp.]|jgi:hypothetical protein